MGWCLSNLHHILKKLYQIETMFEVFWINNIPNGAQVIFLLFIFPVASEEEINK